MPACTKREVATHQRVHLGQAQEEQELEKDTQGNLTIMRDVQPDRVLAQKRSALDNLQLQIRPLPAAHLRELLQLRRRPRQGRTQYSSINSVRERAKLVVNLLNNEELLEEERVKAKTIREKMSNVVGGTTYGAGYGGSYNNNGSSSSGYGGSGYGSSSYSKPDSDKKKNDSYNYGSGLGYFGDYTYNKSTLDKYKDPKNDKPGPTNTTEPKKDEKKSTPVIEV